MSREERNKKNVVFSATVWHFLFPVTLGNLSSASPNINKHPDNIDNMASSQPRRSALLPISNSNSNASKPRVDSTNPKALVLEPTSTTPSQEKPRRIKKANNPTPDCPNNSPNHTLLAHQGDQGQSKDREDASTRARICAGRRKESRWTDNI
ncbi:unnamed protein product [Sphagnum balticum]